MKKTYSFSEVLRIVPGAKEKKGLIQLWIKSGIIRPALFSAGRGQSRGYSFANMVDICAAVTLSAFGVSSIAISAALKVEPNRSRPLLVGDYAGLWVSYDLIAKELTKRIEKEKIT